MVSDAMDDVFDHGAAEKLHPSHVTRFGFVGEICVNCGWTDITGGRWGRLLHPCPNETVEHRMARLLKAGDEFIQSTTKCG